jgi:hypothetical protein
MYTLSRLIQVRRRERGAHFRTDMAQNRAPRTKKVRGVSAVSAKSLIRKDSALGTANALRPRLKPLPEAEDS